MASAETRRVSPPSPEDVLDAAERLSDFLSPTPLLESPALGRGALLKLETVQPTGSFKIRGALAALTLLGPDERVVTASAGNHALGVAHAAALLGLEATVVCAETAAPAKLAALERYPARLVRHGRGYDEAEAHALELAAEGLAYVSPYNDRHVIAGQGTIAVELMRELSDPTTIVCPLGGGGLAAGVALVAATRPPVRIVAVECEASAPVLASLAAGEIVPVEVGPTIADGLAGNLEPGSVTFDLIRRDVTEVVIVSETEIETAIRFLASEHGLVVEGAGAVAVAALLAGRVGPSPGPTVALVTGGNIDRSTLACVLGSA